MPYAEIREAAVGDNFSEERAEMEGVLASEVIARSPNLGLALRYICEKYFSGDAKSIKEYTIAVEALGRPIEFDSRRDSIVRVEISRLRKRLDQLYEGERAGQA